MILLAFRPVGRDFSPGFLAGFQLRHGAETLAERLIAAADGVAVQALFDPELWPPEHQLATLQAAIEPLLTPAGR